MTTNDNDLADALRRSRTHGIVRKSELGGWYDEIDSVGFNYRITDTQAALGLSQLDSFIARRNELADRYSGAPVGFSIILPPAAHPGVTYGYRLFAFQVADRRRIFDELGAAGIRVQVHYVPVHHHPIRGDIGLKPGDLPEYDAVYELLRRPLHPEFTETDQDIVVDALRLDAGRGVS